MKKLRKLFKPLMTVLMGGLPVLLHAQPGVIDDTLDNPVPFDSGATLLIAAAIAYGLKKANEKRKADKL